ncbi:MULTISPECIES: outer membrane lipoprotein chaperone LolA [Pseudoalteromonas]|uniref:Outer-membrane lipoprotein carrier protein n=1 Tax=Pseudoalteromonas amylolytica TaxID=1859457 RepID=A0A1S1MW77_9GAMM|nr:MULTISPECIES: outer membrane lipoprotein chaperone LolA [Pseudoalteromonas]OHU87917.1 outer membrane lipoprotein carrier protein LolA [Pseudoalteromonas sp. JW3]OHU91357.1 outer membrane lipoprotein carrier protein LolA [Pseudoalteromonas amylolytica]
MILSKYLTKSAVVVLGLAFSANVLADAASELKEKLNYINTFQASFAQQVLDEQGNILQQGSGNIALAHPMKIRWQQIQPDETLFVSDGTKAYYYDMFAEQVTVMRSAGLVDTTPFVLLTTREDEQWAKYQVNHTDVGYQIKPREGVESQVEMLEVQFSDQQSLDSVSVKDVSGQTSTFSFHDGQLNKELEGALFSFTVPQGVVVDDQTQGE